MKNIILGLTTLASLFVFAQDEGEVIWGALSDFKGVTFQVRSGGCTDESDFIFKTIRGSDAQYALVTLVRTTPDTCEAGLPHGAMIQFTYYEMGLKYYEAFVITNELRTLRNAISWPPQE